MSKNSRAVKLDSIAKCLLRLEQKRPQTVEQLVADVDLQDIVVVNLERLVQLCVDLALMVLSEKKIMPLPITMRTCFESLSQIGAIDLELAQRMMKAVGFRNLCVHQYDQISMNIVFKILESHLDDFKKFASKMDSVP